MANKTSYDMGKVRTMSQQEVDSFDGVTIENGVVQENNHRQSVFYRTYSQHGHEYSSLKDYFRQNSIKDWLVKGLVVCGVVSFAMFFISFILPIAFMLLGGAVIGWLIWQFFHKG